MAYIKFTIRRFGDYCSTVKGVRQRVQRIKSDVAYIGKYLDSDVKGQSGIQNSFSMINAELANICSGLSAMELLLKSAKTQYKEVIERTEELTELLKQTQNDLRAKRQETVDNINLAVTILGIVACTAATLLAGPVVVLAVSATVSVVGNVVEHTGNTYVETEKVAIDDWGEFFKDTAVDVVIDVGLSAAGSAMSSIATGYIDEAVYSAKAFGQAGTKAVSGTAKGITSPVVRNIIHSGAKTATNVAVETVTGAMGRSVKALGNGIINSVDNGRSFLEATSYINDQMTKAVLDSDEALKDVGAGIAKGVGEAAGGVLENRLQAKLYSPNKAVKMVSNAGVGIAEEVVEGGIKRGINGIIDSQSDDQVTAGDIIGDMFDPTEIAKDALKGTKKAKNGKNTSFYNDMLDSDRDAYLKAQGSIAGMSEKDADRYRQATEKPNDE